MREVEKRKRGGSKGERGGEVEGGAKETGKEMKGRKKDGRRKKKEMG